LEYGIKFDDEPEKAPPTRPPEKKSDAASDSHAHMELYDWLQCVVSAVLCGILVFIFVGRITGIDGSSMLNTLHDKDIVVMSNLMYTPKYGDIVIIETDLFDKPLVKRVIATEGQTIDINFETGDVMIDGKIIIEDYIRQPTMLQA
jgi:signal peptidase I